MQTLPPGSAVHPCEQRGWGSSKSCRRSQRSGGGEDESAAVGVGVMQVARDHESERSVPSSRRPPNMISSPSTTHVLCISRYIGLG